MYKLWSVRGKMPEKDHSLKKAVRRVILRIQKDLLYYRVALAAVVVYLLFMRFVCGAGCPLVWLTGFPCPACGLTRAAKLVFCARFTDAYQMHPMIYPILLFLFLFFFYRYILGKELPYAVWWAVLIFAGCLGLYVYRMVTQFPGDVPMGYYRGNVMRTILNKIHRR